MAKLFTFFLISLFSVAGFAAVSVEPVECVKLALGKDGDPAESRLSPISATKLCADTPSAVRTYKCWVDAVNDLKFTSPLAVELCAKK